MKQGVSDARDVWSAVSGKMAGWMGASGSMESAKVYNDEHPSVRIKTRDEGKGKGKSKSKGKGSRKKSETEDLNMSLM